MVVAGERMPSFKRGLRDLISEPELSEMRMHDPKIADDIAKSSPRCGAIWPPAGGERAFIGQQKWRDIKN